MKTIKNFFSRLFSLIRENRKNGNDPFVLCQPGLQRVFALVSILPTQLSITA